MRISPTGVVLIAALATAPTLAQDRTSGRVDVPSPRNTIDDLVFGRLARLGVQPAPLSSDAVFLRRVYLDAIGTLPTADEARAFLADRDPNRRSQLIDRLLEREEFADYWAMKWSDVLRVKSEFPINLWPNAVQAYHHWIRTSVRDNLPYDEFARALLTESGSNVRVPPVNFYRAVQSREPEAIAQAVALTFMGVRADHWPADRLSAMAVFFAGIGYKPTAEWKEEIVFFDRDKARARFPAGLPHSAALPDGTTARWPPDRDPRDVFATWLIAAKNPWFAQNIVNRVWFWLLGRGIIHEPDDSRPDIPPSHPELLAWLERELITSRYDLKQVYRLILNSTTYQLASVAVADRPGAEGTFAHALLRRIDAEVLVDALGQITGTTESYASPIPEPYTFLPEGYRAIALADGSITSSLLDTFGRSPRDTGLLSERDNRPSAAERLYLLNSSHIQRRLQQSAPLLALIQAKGDVRQMIVGLYLTILSRIPTADELNIASAYAQSAGNRRVAGLDLAWALINSAEFFYRQ